MDSSLATILLIEDNPADQEMTRRALAVSATNSVALEVVHDGEEAIDFLLRRDVYASDNTPVPDLVLLDLNLPKLSGKDVIRRVRAEETLKHMPLIVMTTSHAPEDVLETYRLGCNSYLLKPNRFDEFVLTMQRLTSYWFESVHLPNAN